MLNHIKHMRYFLLILIFSSCSLINSSFLGKDVTDLTQKVCLNADGSGRLGIDGHKYVFGHETLYDQEEARWAMSLNFPLHGQELIELKLDNPQSEMIQNLEEKILKEKKGVNPIKLHKFMNLWATFIKELIQIREKKLNPRNSMFKWSVNKKHLMAKSQELIAVFQNFTGNHFGKMSFSLLSAEHIDKNLKIELVVRKCLDKVD